MSISDLISIYLSILDYALPIAVFFGIANLIVNIILSSAFTGSLDLSGRGRYL